MNNGNIKHFYYTDKQKPVSRIKIPCTARDRPARIFQKEFTFRTGQL